MTSFMDDVLAVKVHQTFIFTVITVPRFLRVFKKVKNRSGYDVETTYVLLKATNQNYLKTSFSRYNISIFGGKRNPFFA